MKRIHKNSIVTIVAGSLVLTLFGFAGLSRAATAVSLGAADDFAVLAGESIVDTTPSVISGDVGLDPAAGTFIGLTAGEVTGTIYNNSGTGPGVQNAALLTSAKNALVTAYDNAAGQTLPSVTTVTESTTNSFNVTGTTLAPGIYKSPSTMGITGTLTLSGSATDIWIFQAVSSLTTASAVDIVLTGGAQACNVFWQVGSSATLGTGTLFKGNVLALTSITDNGGSTVQGRLLARNGTVTLNNTNVVKATCVGLPPSPVIPSGGGVDYWSELPLIDIVKVPSPLALPLGPGSVTYTYTVTNPSQNPLRDIWVKDNKCSPVQYVSGDTNTDLELQRTETWTYRCTKTVSQTETNTATAHGSSNNVEMYKNANATVVVGLPITPPLIHLIKVPNVSIVPAGGGSVTYSYSVTNPGIAPLSDVSIVDDKCTSLPGRVVGHPGDLNKNNLLDPGETFHFTCQSNITQTTTNTGTAEGHANGLTAIDFALATVIVRPPGLPDTGLSPQSPWTAAASAGILVLLTAFAVVLNKRTI